MHGRRILFGNRRSARGHTQHLDFHRDNNDQ
jgi:hypothetical protein